MHGRFQDTFTTLYGTQPSQPAAKLKFLGTKDALIDACTVS